jgi:large subunit ribosomal protein L32
MAVPKKRRSRSKTKSRKANWFHKASVAAKKAWSLAQSIATNNSNSYVIENLSKDE